MDSMASKQTVPLMPNGLRIDQLSTQFLFDYVAKQKPSAELRKAIEAELNCRSSAELSLAETNEILSRCSPSAFGSLVAPKRSKKQPKNPRQK
jgi:hypothetical protein